MRWKILSLLWTGWLLALSGNGAAQQAVNYPGGPDRFPSPDGRYEITHLDGTEPGGEKVHYLSLIRTADQSREPLYTFNRSASVLWCPSSRCLVVHDWTGSNVACPVLFDLSRNPISKDDLCEHVSGWMKEHRDPALASSDHSFITVEKILPDGSLILRAAGHGTRLAFTRIFQLSPQKGTLVLLSSSSKEKHARP